MQEVSLKSKPDNYQEPVSTSAQGSNDSKDLNIGVI